MRWRSAYFSYRAHWSELVNRSLPAHWLCRRVEESDCGGAPVGSNCRESAVLLLTCAAALSLTHWQSALYVWKWAIITIICVPSLVFYNGVIILFPCMMPFLPPAFPFPSKSPPVSSSAFLLPSKSPSFFYPSLYLIYTLTHPDDRNRCTINYAFKHAPLPFPLSLRASKCFTSLHPLD